MYLVNIVVISGVLVFVFVPMYLLYSVNEVTFARFGIFLCTYIPLYFLLVVLMATFWTLVACTSVPLYLGNNIASSRMKLALYLCTAVPGQKKMAIFLSWWQ